MKKIVLVTGGSRGLGRAVAEKLSLSDWTVYASLRDIEKSKKLVRSWENNYKNIKAVQIDITKDKDVKDAVRKIVNNEGRIDALVNIAGYSLAGPTTSLKVQDFQKLLDTNATGALRLIKSVVPEMKKQGGGKIINVTSLNGYVSLPNFGLYSASKFALEALGRALRYELMTDDIWVTNVAPGAILNESKKKTEKLPHKSARDKFFLLKIIMPFITRDQVAEKIENIIIMSTPPAQVLIGADVKISVLLQRLLPNIAWDRLVRFVWSKK